MINFVKVLFIYFIMFSFSVNAHIVYSGSKSGGFYIYPDAVLEMTADVSGGTYVGYYCVVSENSGVAQDFSINFNAFSGRPLKNIENAANDDFDIDIDMYNYNSAQYEIASDNTKINMGVGDTEAGCASGQINFAFLITAQKSVPSGGQYGTGRYCTDRFVKIRSFYNNRSRPKDTTHTFNVCLNFVGDPSLSEIQIKNLDDVVLGNYSGNNIPSVEEEFCVYLSNTFGYNISMADNNVNGTFELSNGLDSIPYTINFKDSLGTSIPVSESIPIASTWFTNDSMCANTSELVKLEIIPNMTAVSNTSVGNYTSVLNITVSPE
jgi:hypothetical protein